MELQIRLPITFDDEVRMPEPTDAEALTAWNNFFQQKRPRPKVLRDWVLKLHNEKKHKQVIACLQAALIQGQAQPWMYEVLAMSMEIDGRPKDDIERVVSSLSDFGSADFGTMMYSGAYLAQFGRHAAALRMYRQASRMFPERSEPYVLGLGLAKQTQDNEALTWAAAGVLSTYWGDDYPAKHRQAENALLERIRLSRNQGAAAQAEELQARLSEARRRDVGIRLTWNGTADLDMSIEEPGGSVCSFEQQETTGGGIFLHDGIGTDRDKAYESYVAPFAYSGIYRVTVRRASGELVGNRAAVAITLHSGTPFERKISRTVTLENQEAGFTFDLADGRRTQPRVTFRAALEAPLAEQLRLLSDQVRFAARRSNEREVLKNFANSRQSAPAGRSGAFGYAPNITLLREGESLTAGAVVSPDRRYVRLSLQPSFSDVTDVFTFSFINGAGLGGSR